MQDIDYFASKGNKLKILKINGERKLQKKNKELSTLPLKEAVTVSNHCFTVCGQGQVPNYKLNVSTILLGHNASTFDTPVLLRNSGSDFGEKLEAMNVWFADSLTLLKELIRKKSSMFAKSRWYLSKNQSIFLVQFLV